MASECINVYMNNPTEGAKDGTCVSNGTFTSPISFKFSADLSGVTKQTIKLAIRTEPGFKTMGETIIKVSDSVKERTYLSWKEDEGRYEEISTNDEITDTNKIFYLTSSAHTELEYIGGEVANPIFEEPGKYKVPLEVIYLVRKVS